MASTYSPSLRLELMATGDQSGTWGDTTNTNLGTLLEQAITGVLSVAEGDAELTLTALDGASDQSRNMVVNLTGAMTGAQNVIVPTAEKLYLIKNSTTGGFAVTVKTAAGSGVAVAAGTAQWVYCDGTNVVQGLSGTMAVQAPGAVAITGGTMAGVTISDYLALAGGTMTGQLINTGSSAGYTPIQLVSTEASAAAGPIVDLYRNSASPAANDILGQVLFNGEDSAGNTQEYGSIQAVIVDATSTSEDSTLDLYALLAGTRTLMLSIGGGAASGIYVPGVIDIGNAADTTLSRSAAGVLAVESNLVPSPASQTTGDVLYRGASSWARLGIGSAGDVLTVSGGVPTWAAPAAGGQPIPSSGSYAVGTFAFLRNLSGGSISNGNTVAGSGINTIILNGTPAVTTGAAQTGTWKNVNGTTLANGEIGYFVRTA